MRNFWQNAGPCLVLLVLVSCSSSGGKNEQDLLSSDAADVKDDSGPLDSASPELVEDLSGPPDLVEDLQVPDADVVQPPEKAKLRFFHAMLGATAVDAYLNETNPPVVSGLSFLSASEFSPLEPGSYDLSVVQAGGVMADALVALAGLQLEAAKAYTGVAFGESPAAAGLLLDEDLSPVTPAMARVRFVHVSTTIDDVDVLGTRDGVAMGTLYEGMGYGQASEQQDIWPGTYVLGLDLDGNGEADVTYSPPPVVEGAVLDVFLVTQPDGNVVLAVLDAECVVTLVQADVVQPPKNAEIRMVNLYPDGGPLDVYLNGAAEPSVAGLDYLEGSDYLVIPEGSYTVDIVAAGAAIGEALFHVSDVVLTGETRYSVAAIESEEPGQPVGAKVGTIVAVDDSDGIPEAEFRIRVGHAAAQVGDVDFYLSTEGSPDALWVAAISPGSMSEYRSLHGGAVLQRLGVDATGDGTPDVYFWLPTSMDGKWLNAYLVVDGDGPKLVLQSPDSNIEVLDGEVIEEPLPLSVRFLALHPTAPGLDVYFDHVSPALAAGITYKQATAYQLGTVGTHDVTWVPAGGALDQEYLTVAGVDFSAGMTCTVVAYATASGALPGFAGMSDSGIQSGLVLEDLSTVSDGMIRLRAMHVGPTLGEADVYQIPESGPPTLLLSDFGFGELSEPLELVAGPIRLGVDLSNDAVPEATFLIPGVPSGFSGGLVCDDG